MEEGIRVINGNNKIQKKLLKIKSYEHIGLEKHMSFQVCDFVHIIVWAKVKEKRE